MKRIALVIVLAFMVSVLACSQDRFDSPQTIEWDGESSSHEVAIQMGVDDIIILGETSELEYIVDLSALELYGVYAVLVRAVEFTEPDMFDYSDWIRSDSDEDVIMIDGVSQTFLIESRKPAVKPSMLRIR